MVENIFFYSPLYPFKKHFFHIKLVDGTKKYRPESQIILDINTADNFFGRNPERTNSIIRKKVSQLVNAWNVKYVVNKEVKI